MILSFRRFCLRHKAFFCQAGLPTGLFHAMITADIACD